ncbi:MAG TPA: CARDB domain-containing protein, partial [Methanomassiliicoccales archaeon]|nr:CARDB domain-containing protein [Methanomassiliicoccales archaeon]
NVLGRKAANDVEVAFYIGNPMAGGVKQGNTTIYLPAGSSNSTSFLWTPTQIGSYSIYVWVNYDEAVLEYSYSNNIASSSLEVILVAENGDWVVDTAYTMTSSTFSHQHNIIVEGNGYLVFEGTSVMMLRNATITQIVVRDNGTLVLSGATLNADFGLKIYIFDNGHLSVNSSTIMPNVSLIMDDDSQVYMHGSRIRGAMSAPSTSSVSLVTFNTTFDLAINDFGGDSMAVLTGSTIAGAPPVSPKDNAVIHLYSWIVAQVFDGTGDHPLANVHVEVRSFPSTMYFTGSTDVNGTVFVRALSAIVTSSGPQLYGNYVLNATYWYDGDRYDSSDSPIASVLYISTRALIRSDAYVRMDLPGAKPDIDPPFYVSDLSPLRGSDVTLSTVINNIGVVTGYDIVVRFSDVSASGTVVIKDYVIEVLDPMSSVNVTVTWVAAYPLGQHNLTVTVDPLNEIPELNEDNNVNYTLIEVLGVPDLSVTPADIDVGDEPARGREVIVTAQISNLGDRTASDVTIEFYDSVEGYIGNDTISNIPTGQKREATVSWTPLTAGDRIITVIASMGNTSDEGDLTNNEAEISVNVADYPDLVAMDVGFLVNGVAK